MRIAMGRLIVGRLLCSISRWKWEMHKEMSGSRVREDVVRGLY